MATVKLTSSLEYDINGMLDRAFQPRINQVVDQMKTCCTAEQVLDTYIDNTGGHDLYQKCSAWLPKSKHLDSMYYYDGKRLEYFNLEFTDNELRAIPRGISDAVSTGAAYFAPLFKAYVELAEKLASIHEEKSNARKNIIDAFRAYPSVNAAVKAHPELEHMLPNSAKEKMAQKVERNRNTVIDVSVDGSKIKQIATLNKLYSGATS